jgi:O-antigen/teichoic acid export membrane protein
MVGAYTAAWLAASLFSLRVAVNRLSFTREAVVRLIRTGLPASLGDIANALSYRADVLLLAWLAGTSAVGVYALAVQALEPLWILAGSAAGGLLLTLPSASPTEWRPRVRTTARRAALWTAAGTAVVIVILPGVVWVLGPSFGPTPAVALALGPAIVFLAVSKVTSVLQLVAGRLWWTSLISWTTLVVNIALNLLLIPAFGALGAALASTGSYFLSMCIWLVAMSRFSPDSASRRRPSSLVTP